MGALVEWGALVLLFALPAVLFVAFLLGCIATWNEDSW